MSGEILTLITPAERNQIQHLEECAQRCRTAQLTKTEILRALTFQNENGPAPLGPRDFADYMETALNGHFLQDDAAMPADPVNDLVRDTANAFRSNGNGHSVLAGPVPVIVNLADVKPEPVRWLWPGRIPLGKLTLITGCPGVGKSLFLIDLTARVTAGLTWPVPVDSGEASPGDVLILSAEDDLADTIRPRLDAAGADVQRCQALTMIRTPKADGQSGDRLFDLSQDVQRLEAVLKERPAIRLLTIDPVSAYLGRIEENSNGEVRGILGPLAELASRYDVAIVMLSHTNKQGGQKALHRNLGSVAFVAAARAAYLVVRDEQNPERRLWLPTKNNLGRDAGGLAFSIMPKSGTPVLEWETDAVSTTADEALSQESGGHGNSEIEEAVKWLRELLADGPKGAKEVQEAAKLAGIGWRTVQRARSKAGVSTHREGFGPGSKCEWRAS